MEQFMTSEEIAELLHVDPVTIRRLVNKGDLSAYRIGADYRFAPADLQNYLQRQRLPAHAENAAGSNNPLNQFSQLLRKVIQGKYTTPTELLNRFDRLTKRLRRVVEYAQEEALRLQHGYIGTEHLLLGLLREEGGIAAQVLTNLSIQRAQVLSAVEAIVGRGEQPVQGDIHLTPRSKKVFELAALEAHRLNHRFIGTEHLLLGLVREGEGIAANILKSFGLQAEQIRAETVRVLQQHTTVEEGTPDSQPVPAEAASLLAEGETGLTCAFCGAHSPVYFRYCFNCGQTLTRVETDDSPPESPASAEN